MSQSRNVEASVALIRHWGEERDWRGYDPYDGLTSPLAPTLTFGTALGRRLLTQLVKNSPVNLRPALGIRPAYGAKGIALIASAYARLWAAERDDSARKQAARWLDWLVANSHTTASGIAWTYHFDVQTRFFAYGRDEPNAIATCFATNALLEGCELLDDNRWAAAAERGARYLETELLVWGDQPYFRYVAAEPDLVHNANLLACATLVHSAELLDDRQGALGRRVVARRALRTSLDAQRPDGSWRYAESPEGDWVDNFHTGYVLESLVRCLDLVPDAEERLARGVGYWREHLFLPDETPKYSVARAHPFDSHCYAQAIETWLALVGQVPDAFERAEVAGRLLIERMLDPSGYVHFQVHRLWTNKVPFIRWSTAPAFRALAGMLLARHRNDLRAQRREERHRADLD